MSWRPRRRDLLGAAAAAVVAGCATTGAPDAALSPQALLDDLERRSFDYFWQTTNPANGLVPDRWPTPSFSSVAAVGFGLSAYAIGMARGWITREQAVQRTLVTLRFFHGAPQGPQPTGVAGHRGFYYHFLDMARGERHARCELSTVDTALFIAGALHARAVYDRPDRDETEIRRLAEAIYARIDWPFAQLRGDLISMGWHPETGYIAHDWTGYNEAMIVVLLALGSPTHPVAPAAWDAWARTYATRSWGTEFGETHLRFASFFGHHFSHAWIDFRGMADAFLRDKRIDYFENTRRATRAQRNYAIANPAGWAGYGEDAWGITACDGPADVQREFGGRQRLFRSYAGRGMGGDHAYDDGTIAPYGAASSMPFEPDLVAPMLARLHARHGRHVYGRYGWYAFNRSFTYADVPLVHGRLVPGFGWVDTDFLGIEVGPALLMLANHRDEAVWRPMRGQDWLVRGLERAGFGGGWLGARGRG